MVKGVLVPHSDAGTVPQPSPIKILVVEDEVLIRHEISEALRDLGVSVVEAATADEAWDYLLTHGPVDLVFTDFRMPGSMTGLQLAEQIRAHYPYIQVMLTSGHFVTQGRSGPILSKPYRIDRTAAALAELALKSRNSEAE
jgi:CheY-like chemotaxis protein